MEFRAKIPICVCVSPVLSCSTALRGSPQPSDVITKRQWKAEVKPETKQTKFWKGRQHLATVAEDAGACRQLGRQLSNDLKQTPPPLATVVRAAQKKMTACGGELE